MRELLKFPAAWLAVSGQMAKPCAVLPIFLCHHVEWYTGSSVSVCEFLEIPSKLGFSDPFFALIASKVLLGIGVASNRLKMK